jgi:hypothetical protein
MTDKFGTIDRISQLLNNYECANYSAILKLRYAIGKVIQDALQNGEYKSVNDASAKIADSVKRKLGKGKSQNWYYKCWEMETKLTPEDRATLLHHINNDVTPSDILIIVGKPQEDIPAIMKTIRHHKFEGFLVRKNKQRIVVTHNKKQKHNAWDIHNGDDIYVDGFLLRHFMDWNEELLTDHLTSLRQIVTPEMYERCDALAKSRTCKEQRIA